MGYLDNAGLAHFWGKVKGALDGKQDKLAGAAGQVVGFDADGKPVAQSTAGLASPAGADGKSAYQYAVDGGYTGTEAEFQALMADAATKAYVDSLIGQVRAEAFKAAAKIACLVIHTGNSEQRTNLKLTSFALCNEDYSLTYSGTLPYDIVNNIVLEPPPGYAFTGLAYTWLPALKIGTGCRMGILNADGAITFNLEHSDAGATFTFVSMASGSAPARFILEVA